MRKIIFGLPATFFLLVAALWSWQTMTFVALPLDVPIDLSQRGRKTFTLQRAKMVAILCKSILVVILCKSKLPHIRVFQDQKEVKSPIHRL
jgi:hypothetical protein